VLERLWRGIFKKRLKVATWLGAIVHELVGLARIPMTKTTKKVLMQYKHLLSNARSLWNHRNHIEGSATTNGRTIFASIIISIKFGKVTSLCTRK
jgi:hypothetical protein